MGDSAAFFQTFYQHEVLFKVPEKELVAEDRKEELPAESPVALIQEPEPLVVSPPVAAPAPPPVPAVSTRVVEPVAFPPLQHSILVLIDESKQSDLLPSDALLLENILKATGHSMAETDILNFSYIPQADARTVLSQKSTNYFITFGVPLIRLQLDLLLPPYMPKQIEGIWFLLADPLSVIDADKSLKKRLWQALQKMFL